MLTISSLGICLFRSNGLFAFVILTIAFGLIRKLNNRKMPFIFVSVIDQTRGYWNAGYEYWRWNQIVDDNDYGIERTTRSIPADMALQQYLWTYTNLHYLRVLLSIGTFIWIDIVMLVISLLKKDKIGTFLSLPILLIVETLLIATPVFSEFRYIYSAFCTLPIVIIIALRPVIDGD